MERRALLVDAFTDDPLDGNAAGVVPDAGALTDDQMQAVAAELGASETAFVRPSDAADRRLRYFTPTTEVDLCGHATVAAHAFLHAEGDLPAGEHTVETNSGVRGVRVDEDGTAWYAGDVPSVREVDIDGTRVADALGINSAALLEDLPFAVASSGLPFLVVPVDYLSTLHAMSPDDDAVADLCEAVDATGLYAFTFDTLGAESTAHGRAFVPLAGISEDPVTGTASGAAAAYLRGTDAFDERPTSFIFEQGHVLDRPGTVRVRVDGDVWVGGAAAVSLDGTLRVPASSDDEILEA